MIQMIPITIITPIPQSSLIRQSRRKFLNGINEHRFVWSSKRLEWQPSRTLVTEIIQTIDIDKQSSISDLLIKRRDGIRRKLLSMSCVRSSASNVVVIQPSRWDHCFRCSFRNCCELCREYCWIPNYLHISQDTYNTSWECDVLISNSNIE